MVPHIHIKSGCGDKKAFVFACACVFKCIWRAAVCFGEGLMIHLWPSTMWHSQDCTNSVLIISSICMQLLYFIMHKAFLLGLKFFFIFFLKPLRLSAIVFLKPPKKSPFLKWFLALNPDCRRQWSCTDFGNYNCPNYFSTKSDYPF